MKYIYLLLFLIAVVLAGRAQQVPIAAFSSGGGQGSGSIPAFFGSFGQPLVYPRTSPAQNGGGVMNANEFMFPTAQLADEPTAQPTGLTFTFLTATSFTVSFVAPASVPSGYIVLRKQGSSFTAGEVPSDGVEYALSDAIGSATVVSTGTAISIPQASLASSTQYSFAVFSYNTQEGKEINYLTSTPLTGNQFTLAIEPTAPAAGVTFSEITSSSVAVSYTAPASPPSGYIVVRRTGASPTSVPGDGTSYTVGAALGNGTIAYIGTELGFTDPGLDPLTTYHYRVFVFNGSASTANYLTSSSANGSVATLEPGDEDPTNLVLTTSGSSTIDVSFTPAVQANVQGYLVLRSTATPNTNPIDGIICSPGQVLGNAVVVSTNQTSFTDTDLAPATTYNYKVLSYTNALSPDYIGAGITGSQTTWATQPEAPESVSYTNKTATSFTVTISTAAAPDGFLVIRKTGAVPTGVPENGVTYSQNASLGDGLVVYVGATASFEQTGLITLTTYHYAVFAYNGTSGTYHYSAVLNSNVSTLATDPGSGPSALIVSNVSESEIDFSFTAASAPVTGYLILRKADSEATGVPDGGTVYNVGDQIGDAEVVYKGTSVTFEDNGLQPSTHYYYSVIAFNGQDADNSINYLNTAVLAGSQRTLASEPTNQPTNLQFSAVTSNSLSGSYTAATGGADGYLVVRNEGTDAYTGTLNDGATYTLGQVIGNGTVVYLGSNLGFSETGLTAEQTYRYTVFAYNGSEESYNYNVATPLSGTITTEEAPQTQPTNLVFSNITASTITGTFTAAVTAPGGGYLVLRKQGALPTSMPQNGVTYVAGDELGDGKIVSVEGPATLTFIDTNLQAAQIYYYLVFAFNGTTYEVISPLSGSQTTLATEPGTQPTSLSFVTITPVSYRVDFTPPSGGLPVIVVRNQGSAPTFVPEDGISYTTGVVTGGTIVSVGVTNSVNESGLTGATQYFYALYAYNGTGNRTNYRTTAPLTGSVTTLALEPTAQPTLLTFSNVSATGTDVAFTAATSTPSGYIVLRKQTAVTQVPLDGVVYTSASVIGDAQVVHVGNTTSFSQMGLSNATTYFYKVFSYNGSGVATNYKTADGLSGNVTTLAIEPAAPANVTIDQITSASLRVTISDTNTPTGYLIVRSVTALNASPEDGITYNVTDVIGNGTVVSVGAGMVLQQDGLTPNTEYYYTAFSFNGSAKTTNYSSISVSDNEFTEAINQEQPTNIQFANVGEREMDISFTAPVPAPGAYLVVRKAGSLPSFTPADGATYAANQNVGDNTIVVTVGSNATNYTLTSLEAATVYFYKVFSYTGTTYVTSGPLTGSRSTLTEEPLSSPSAIDFDNVTSGGFDVLVTNVSEGYMVIRRQGVNPVFLPQDGTSYSVGQSVAANETVVYIGNASSFTENGLAIDTQYNFAIYAYNGSEQTINYNPQPMLGNQRTNPGNMNQPSALQYTIVAHNRLGLSFTPPANEPTGYIAIRGDGFVPTGSPQNGTSYNVGNSLINGSGTVAYVGTLAEFINTTLEAEEIYHYRIYSFFGTGISTTYVLESPLSGSKSTLAEEPIGPPSSFTASSVAHNSLLISFTPVSASGYLIVRSTVEPGLDPPAPQDGERYNVGDAIGPDGTVVFIGNASANISQTQLEDATTYHYRIYAYRGRLLESTYPTYNYHSDFLPGDATTLPEDISAPTLDISETATTVAFGSAFTVIAEPEESDPGSMLTSVTVRYRSLNDNSFSSPLTMSLVSGKYQRQIEGSEIGEVGVEYEVTATNSFGLPNSKSATSKVTFANAPIPAVDLTFGTDQSKYNIIAVPLEKDNANKVGDVFEELGTENKSKWRMFHYESATQLLELSRASVLEPGKGYWLIAKDQVAINLGDGEAVSITEEGFEISLQYGYNQIGNPYMFNISWADVQAASGTSATLKTFDGNFVEDTELKQFEGGFVLRGESDPEKLIIPAVKNTGGRTSTRQSTRNPLSEAEWQVNFTVENGARVDRFGGIGMHPKASIDSDEFDDFTMPRLGEYIELNHAKERFAGLSVTKDIVPTTAAHTWSFEVATNIPGVSTLRWDNSYFGENQSELMLWDEVEQRSIDMRTVMQYQFTGTRTFKIIFGNEEYVKEKAKVQRFVVNNVYPNPTENDLNITFSIPDESKDNYHVVVNIVNQIGQIVATVFEGDLTSGYHEVHWNGIDDNGTKPSGGMYILQVECGYDRQSKRIILK